MLLLRKVCRRCGGIGFVVHPIEPKAVKCERCHGKGKVRK